jgi:pyridoxamine 5'-phosphate oxidase family protein
MMPIGAAEGESRRAKETPVFSDAEKAFLKGHFLARIATVSPDGQPDVAAVVYEFDGVHLLVGGHRMERSNKYKNVVAGNDRVAIVIDDVESLDPWMPRGIKVHGRARLIEREGRFVSGAHLEITPEKHWAWGVTEPVMRDGFPLPQKAVVWK